MQTGTRRVTVGKSRRLVAVVLAAAPLALGVAACGSGSHSSSGSAADAGNASHAAATPVHRQGTLTILSKYSLTEQALDPAKSWALDTTSLGLLDRRLTTWKISRTGPPQVVPDLATSTGTPSDGGRVWTYHLKPGIRFSNGQPITSADFKYAVERTYAPALSGGINYQKPLIAGTKDYDGPFDGKQLSSIQTPNPRTIVFHLQRPYGDWPWVVSTTSMAPVPHGHAPAATFGNHPVTSGPYAVQSASNHEVVMVRNKYWKASTDPTRSAGPNKIVIELNQDPTVEAQTLISDGPSAQDAFGADFVPPAQLAQVENNPSVKSRLVTSPASPLEYLAVNVQSPKLKRLNVRQALEYAVNRQAAIIAAGGADAAEPATTLITPGIAGRVPFNLYPAGTGGNPAKAKALLSQAGTTHLSLTLATQNDPISLGVAQAVQQAYQHAGIKVAIKSLSDDAYTSLVTGNSADGYDLAVADWQPDFPSAMDNIEPLFDSADIGNGNYNISRYSDPAVDKLMSQAEGTINRAKAGALWAKIDRTIVSSAAVVPLYYTRNSFLRGSHVANFFIGTFPAYPVYTAVSLNGT